MMRRWMLLRLLLPLFCAGFGGGAKAAISCYATPGPAFNFGTLYTTSGYSFSAVGSANVLCTGFDTPETATKVVRVCGKFTQPSPAKSTAATNARYSVTYNIYKDPQRTTLFGSTDQDVIPFNLDATSGNVAFRAYGLITNADYASAGTAGAYTGPAVTFNAYFQIFSNVSDANNSKCSSSSPYAPTSPPTAPISVNITVGDGCAIAATPMIFPPQGAITRDVTTTSTLTVKCTDGTLSPWVSLDSGVNALSGQRRMSSGAGYINYDLYSDSSYSKRWGATQNVDTVSVAASPAGIAIPVYGKIPIPATQPAAGTYTDVITATVHF